MGTAHFDFALMSLWCFSAGTITAFPSSRSISMSISYIESTTIEIECPNCGHKAWMEIRYLIGTGIVPRTDATCGGCQKQLAIQADLSVDIEVVGEG